MGVLMKSLVIFHAVDTDGRMSAAIVAADEIKKGNLISFLAFVHAKIDLSNMNFDRVIFVDCFHKEMYEQAKMKGTVEVIDHHPTSKQDFPPSGTIYADDKSAIELAYEAKIGPAPEWVKLISIRDRFQDKNPDYYRGDSLQRILHKRYPNPAEFNFQEVDQYIQDNLEELIVEGTAEREAYNAIRKPQMEAALRMIEWKGINWHVVGLNQVTIEDWRLLDSWNDGSFGIATFIPDQDPSKRVFSLRGPTEFGIGNFCKSQISTVYGGGGGNEGAGSFSLHLVKDEIPDWIR